MKNKLSETLFVLLFCIIFWYLFAVDKINYFINPNYYWWIVVALIITTIYGVVSLFWTIKLYSSLQLVTKWQLYGLLLLSTLLLASIFVVPLKPLNSQSLLFTNKARIITGKNKNPKNIQFSKNAVTNLTIREWQVAQKNSPNLTSFEDQKIVLNDASYFLLDEGGCSTLARYELNTASEKDNYIVFTNIDTVNHVLEGYLSASFEMDTYSKEKNNTRKNKKPERMDFINGEFKVKRFPK